MQIFSVVILALTGVSISILIKKIRPELSVVIAVATGVILLMSCLTELTGVLDALRALAADYGIEAEYVGLCIKIIGIAYVAQLGVQVCTDAGETAVAGKVELCGRVLILAVSLPTATATLKLAAKMLLDAAP